MANIGEEIVDGSVRWIVRDTRAEATTLSSGMMSAADKIKLNGYPSKTNGTTKYLREDGSWQAIAGYSLPKATTSALGGVMIGNNLSIDSNGKVSLSLSGNANHVLKGDGTWSAIESYSLPVASTSGIGGVKIGSNTGITIGSGNVISLTSASTAAIGGIKFPNTGTDKFLTANGTWATINTAAVASASNVFGVDSKGLVPAPSQFQKDNLYYLSAAGWKSRTIPLPTQVGVPPFYDAFDTYTPSWTVDDTDVITFEVLNATDKALIERYPGGKSQFAYDLLYNYHQNSVRNGLYGANLPVFYGSIDGSGGGAYGKQAGIYIYKVTPQLGYLWNNDTGHNTTVLRTLGVLGESESPKNTRMTLYAHFIIRKAKNTLTLGAKSQIVYYNSDPEILISTAAQKDKEDGGAGVANDSANVVFDYPQFPTLSEDGMSYSHPVPSTGELKDVLDSKIPTGSDGDHFSEVVAYVNRDRLPWANLDAYWTLKHITSAETGLSSLKFKLLSCGSNSYARFNRYFSQIKINLISSETDNYMSQKTGLVIITKPDVKSFDYLNAADDYSTLEFTNSNSVKTLYFDYYSNQPLEYKITYTKVKEQNDTTFPVVKVQTLTDFCEETFKALRKDQKGAKVENNLDCVPTLPAYDGIELKDSYRDITIKYKKDDKEDGEEITETLSAVGSLVRVASGIDAAGTSFEEITGLYNGYGTTTDTDDSSKFVKLAIKAPDNKWYFVESEYKIKDQKYNTANRPIKDKEYKRYLDNPYHPNYFMTDQFTVYRQFRKAIVFVQPLVSHGSCTLTLYTSTNDVYIPYTYAVSGSNEEIRQKAYYTRTFKQKEFKLTSKINIVESSTKNICAGTEDSIITGNSDLTTIPATQIATTTTHNLSWLAAVAASGQAANYIKVGDYIAFKLQKTLKLEGTVLNDQGNPVQAEINKDTTQRAVVIGINHNPNCINEGIEQTGGTMNHNGIHFAVGRDGVDTAYHSMRMNKDVDSEKNHNLGGWPQTSLRRWLNSYFVTDQVQSNVYEARGNADIDAASDRTYYRELGGDDKGYFLNLPTKLQQAIKLYTKPYFAYKGFKKNSEEVGYDRGASITSGSTIVSLSAAAIRDADPTTNPNEPGYFKEESTFKDKIWLMSQNEVRGQYSTGNSSTYEYNNTIRYDYYKAANPLVRYMHTDTETTIDWWWRSINTDSYNNFRKLSNELSTSAKPKNLYGIVPCFVI